IVGAGRVTDQRVHAKGGIAVPGRVTDQRARAAGRIPPGVADVIVRRSAPTPADSQETDEAEDRERESLSVVHRGLLVSWVGMQGKAAAAPHSRAVYERSGAMIPPAQGLTHGPRRPFCIGGWA